MDIKEVLLGVVGNLKESAGEKWDEVKDQAMEYVAETEQRLLLVATESTTGQLSSEFLLERAKDEITILESQAISLGIIGASFTQETVSNTIQNVLALVIDLLTGVINKQLNNADN